MPTTPVTDHVDPATDPVDQLIVDESPVSVLSADPVARDLGARTVLVIGSVALASAALAAGARVLAFCDSAVAHAALPEGVERVTPTDDLGPVDVAWVLLPTDLDELDQWCAWIAGSGAIFVGGARIKGLNPSMNSVIGRHFGEVRASLGRHKSRVLHGSVPRPQAAARPGAPWPRWRDLDLPAAPSSTTTGTNAPTMRTSMRVARHGGTFASGRLDAGTRLLLQSLGKVASARPEHVLDWGSGAGIVTTVLADVLPHAQITAVDLSWAGAEATRLTLAANQITAEVAWTDGNAYLEASDDVDLVISNPPFHSGIAKDSSATEAMIEIAADRLLPGGQLVLVHNSHLPWLRLMRRHGFADVLAQNTGYTVSRLRR